MRIQKRYFRLPSVLMTLTLTAASALAQVMSGGSYAMTSSVQAALGVSAANKKSIVGTAGQTTAGGPYHKDAYAQSAGFWFDDANANLTPNGCPLSFSQPGGSPLTSASPTIAVSADFNKDGKLDFAVTSRNANTVQVFLGNNNGGFAPLTPVSLGTPPGAYFLTAADFNQDNKPDLAVTFIAGSIAILLGDGQGGFSSPTFINVAFGDFIIAGDFNLDGKPDLAVTGGSNMPVTILLGDGHGNFTQPTGSPITVGNSYVPAVSDVNLDGKPDLIVGGGSSGAVHVLLGDGAGHFTKTSVTVGGVPAITNVGDFNGDGKPDLILPDNVSNQIRVMLGDGLGGFSLAQGSPVSVSGVGAFTVVSDFDLDGNLDVAAITQGSNNVTILLGDGHGHLSPSPISIVAPDVPASLIAADFNVDGRPDLILNVLPANAVAVELNVCGAAPTPTPTPTPITLPSVSINDVSQAEGNSGSTLFMFTVSLSAASTQTVSVNYTTADVTAQVLNDYQPASGLVSFAPGETSKQIPVVVNGDTQVEPNETFTVNLFNLINANVGKVTGLGTILNDDSPAPATTVQFSQPSLSVPEDLGALTITVTRSGDTSAASSVDYKTTDGTAKQKADFEYAAGTLTFAPGETSKTLQVLINEDMYVEGGESFSLALSNPAGAALGTQSTTTVNISDDSPEANANPIDDAGVFVYMHYHDFLNREPDAAGLAFWTNQITSCNGDTKCSDAARANVSAAFYLSVEFQQTGYLLYLMQKESYATLPKYATFMRDLQEVSRGVIVNAPGWQQKLSDNQQQFAQAWAGRPEFKAAYDSMSNTQFVNTLYANAGVVAPLSDRDALVNRLDGANETRAAALLDVASNATYRQKEMNAGFVLMEYFGYLRRDPNASPDSDMGGYNFWLDKMNKFGDYQSAEMVRAFVISNEYRQRFGQ